MKKRKIFLQILLFWHKIGFRNEIYTHGKILYLTPLIKILLLLLPFIWKFIFKNYFYIIYLFIFYFLKFCKMRIQIWFIGLTSIRRESTYKLQSSSPKIHHLIELMLYFYLGFTYNKRSPISLHKSFQLLLLQTPVV